MTPAQQAKVDKLKATISKLREDVKTWKLKAKGAKGITARAAGGRARPASSKGRTRARTRSARGSESVATA